MKVGGNAMVKHKIVRRHIHEYLKAHGKGNIYDFEDYMSTRNKNCPDRKTILAILNRDERCMVVDSVESVGVSGAKSTLKVFTLKEEI